MSEIPPLPWDTIPELLEDAARVHADREAVVDGDVRLTFPELLEQARRLAQALETANVGAGDRVAIWGSNGWRWVVVACGVWLRGAALVPLATRWKAPEVGPLIERTGARLLFAEHRSAGQPLLSALAARYGSSGSGGGDGGGGSDDHGARAPADPPLAGLPGLQRIVALDAPADDETNGNATSDLAETWDAFVAKGERASRSVTAGIPDTPDASSASSRVADDAAVPPDALAEILFTSGTTGAPKGVELAHRQLLQAYWDWSGIGGLEPGDRFLVIPPYSHGFGINGGILACLMRGVANVPVAVFDTDTALERIARERISVISGPPTLFATLMNRPDFDPAAVDTLRLAFVGAAAVPTELIHAMHERMGIERVVNAYGLIEVCVVSMTRRDDPPAVISTTTGRAMPGVEVRIVDDEGRDVPDGESGEVLVRSQGVMRGYWRQPDQTAATISEDGWCRTGDVGVRDAVGHIRVVDRLKDAYNCGGFSAYPAEIESRLLERDEVAQVAVVGVPDERLGEVGHAFVIAARDREVDPDALLAWARENMANYKVPREITVVDTLPLNANGKVQKDVLRERAVAQGVPAARQ